MTVIYDVVGMIGHWWQFVLRVQCTVAYMQDVSERLEFRRNIGGQRPSDVLDVLTDRRSRSKI